MTIFSSTEPKFVISFTKITWKNTLLNSKKAVIHFACLCRPWVVSALAVSAPESFQFVDLFGLIEDVANNN